MATMEEILTGSADKPAEPEADPKEEAQEQEAVESKPEEKPEEQAQEEPAVSTEEEAPKGEEAAPPAAEKHNIPIATLLDEREKRQNLERELAELKKSQKPDEGTDFFEDPEGALKERDKVIEERLLQNKLEISQAMAKQSHDDFDEVLANFTKAMETDETMKARGKVIWNDALSQPHPAESVYNAIKRELVVQEISDPAEYRAKLKAELLAEIAKEQEPEKEPEKPDAPDIPESLAEERSVGSRKGPEWAGPTPLNKIIKSA